jgi:outer membrane protein assembly factor BamD (BamD/ComL family)
MISKGILTRNWILTTGIAVSLIGCATTSRDWEQANRLGTVQSYLQFVNKHPDSEQADDARRFIADLRIDATWRNAEEENTIAAYETFLKKHPQTRHTEQANSMLEALRYQHAKEEDSIIAYKSYLEKYADSHRSADAQARLRKLQFEEAKKQGTVAAFESFFAQYAEGADVDELRAQLPAAKKLDKALALGSEIMSHAPQTYIQVNNFNMTGMSTARSDPTAQDLAKLKAMLKDGADPNAIRVSGYEPAGKKSLGNGFSIVSTGRPGVLVRAERGGMTLLEYCRAQKLNSIAKLLKKYGAK